MGCFPFPWAPAAKGAAVSAVVLSLAAFPRVLHGATWNIQVDASGDAPTIQAGIDSAAVGDTVLVWPGTYYENVNFLGKDIVLLAKYGPEVTTIDGSHAPDAVVTIGNWETRAAVLEGFTITGGRGTARYNTDPRGGGIMSYRSSPTIRGNRIVGNHAYAAGGMAAGNAQVVHPRPFPLIEGNLFMDNTAETNAGALSIEHVDIIVRRNVFRGNSCAFDGGAVRAYFGEGSAVFERNMFFENTAGDHGGGLYVVVYPGVSAPVTIRTNILVRNVALGGESGDTGSGGGAWLSRVPGAFVDNTLVSNSGLGESPSSGGGLLLSATTALLEVDGNIFALNEGSGIACRLGVTTNLGPNLFWQNTVADMGGEGSACPAGWTGQTIADPLFCDSATDDFRVASDSPALTGEEVMGAFTEPGCGPGVGVRPTTWGRLKALYR